MEEEEEVVAVVVVVAAAVVPVAGVPLWPQWAALPCRLAQR